MIMTDPAKSLEVFGENWESGAEMGVKLNYRHVYIKSSDIVYSNIIWCACLQSLTRAPTELKKHSHKDQFKLKCIFKFWV